MAMKEILLFILNFFKKKTVQLYVLHRLLQRLFQQIFQSLRLKVVGKDGIILLKTD